MTEFYITNNTSLQKVIDLVNEKKVVAIDTEFTREKTYYPILSLIQIGVDGKSFAVDCQADVDLRGVYQFIADKNIKKILHSCCQDLQIFHQKSNLLPNFVRDVQMMANFCGIGFNVGYSTLVEEFIGIEIDKKLQRSNWQKRPLDKKQIDYALLDVVYLEEIYTKLKEMLLEKERKKWFLEEISLIDDYFVDRTKDGLFKNFSMSRGFSKNPKQIEKVKHLILWREKKAQEKDVPRQHFLTDNAVENIVAKEDFGSRLSKKEIEEIKDLMLKIDKMDVKLDLLPKRVIMTEGQKKLFNRAKNAVEEVAFEEKLKEQFLIPNQALKDIVIGRKKIDEAISGWRYDLFGKKIEKLIS